MNIVTGIRLLGRFGSAAWVCLIAVMFALPVYAAHATPNWWTSEEDGPDPKVERLTRSTRLEIIRALAHEYAEVLIPLPAARKKKEAVRVDSNGAVNEDGLRKVLAKRGVALETGTVVQLTGLKFNKDHIFIEINGGGKIPGIKWYERIQITGPGGTVQPRSNTRTAPSGANWTPGSGSYIRIDFGRSIPEISPEEIREMLAKVLSFGAASATLPWIETIPEEFRDAIREKRAMVGMNRDMIRAALGQPERKVREVGDDGQEYEDWIFGIPPYLVFVTFLGDEVVQVREFR